MRANGIQFCLCCHCLCITRFAPSANTTPISTHILLHAAQLARPSNGRQGLCPISSLIQLFNWNLETVRDVLAFECKHNVATDPLVTQQANPARAEKKERAKAGVLLIARNRLDLVHPSIWHVAAFSCFLTGQLLSLNTNDRDSLYVCGPRIHEQRSRQPFACAALAAHLESNLCVCLLVCSPKFNLHTQTHGGPSSTLARRDNDTQSKYQIFEKKGSDPSRARG